MRSSKLYFLVAGDVLVIFIDTLIGFARHSLSLISPRMLTTFLPLLAAWALFALVLGAYRTANGQLRQLWRPLVAALLAAPLAAVLRAIWLDRPVDLVFTLVLTGVTVFSIGVWRLIWSWIVSTERQHG